jgi:hypothetical protein
MTGKTLAIFGQARTTAIAHKESATKLTLKILHTRGDRRLRDVQTLCRRHKAASANNFKEGTGQFNIHKSSLGHVLYQYLRYQFALYFIIADKLRSSYSPPLINGSPHPHDDSRNIFSA